MKSLTPLEMQALMVLLYVARTVQRMLVRAAIRFTAAAHSLGEDDYDAIVKQETTRWKEKHSKGGLTS